jgi:hypothetical protein
VNPFSLAVMTQAATATIALALPSVAPAPVDPAKAAAELASKNCSSTPDIRALGQLPAGLVVADIDLGPYIAALTPHRALAGPYHRMNTAIKTTFNVLDGAADASRQLLAAEARSNADGALYLATCVAGVTASSGQSRTVDQGLGTLRQRLADGELFSWLEPAPVAPGALRIWRVTGR